MIIRCHECGTALTPDLPELEEFKAVVLCRRCHTEPLPVAAVDIEGRRIPVVEGGDEGMERTKAMVDHHCYQLLEEFTRQVRTFKEAYLAMTAAGRQAFKRYLQAVILRHGLEDEEAFANPYCLFRAALNHCRLEPADGSTPYAGLYVGHESREVALPKALAAATEAWDEGHEFRIGSLDELRRYE